MRLYWAYGLLRSRYNLPSAQTKSAKVRKSKEKSQRSQSPVWKYPAALRQPGFCRRVIKFIIDLWHSLEKKDICVALHIGLDDPADTGQLWSLIGPLAGLLSSLQSTSLLIEPVFHEAYFDFEGAGTIRIIPLKVLSIMLGMILSPIMWRGFRQA